MPQLSPALHPEEFTVPLPSNQEGLAAGVEAEIGCIDPNPAQGIYLQFPGGGQGLGYATLLAKEMEDPGFTERTNATPQGLAKLAGHVMIDRGYRVLFHEPCAYIENGEPVSLTIASNPSGSTVSKAAIFEPSTALTESDRIVQGAARIHENGTIAAPQTVYEGIQKNEDGFDGLHKAHHNRTNEPVHGFAVIHEEGMAFDVQRANDKNSRYYVATRQAMVVASEVVQAYLGVKRETFMAAAGATLAATHTVLEQATKQELPIYPVGEAA